MRDSFRRLAERTAHAVGSPWAFLLALLTIAVWGVTGPFFKYSDTWQLFINTGTTIVTFLMVFLIQNTQNRETRIVTLQWFEDSNRAYAKHPGFIRRILLQPREGGNYVAIVEHESYETFMAMHTSSTQADFRQRVQAIFEGNPRPTFYDVVTG